MSLDATGLTVPRLHELVQALGARAKTPEFFGPGFATGADTPNGQIVALVAEQIAAAWEGLAEVYAAFDPNAAEGAQLDNLCALVGIEREQATKSQVGLQFTCEGSGTIPAGALVRVAGGPRFATKTATAFYAAPGTSVNKLVDAEAEYTGPIEADAATLTELVNPVYGVTSVTNPAAAVPGRNIETDAELRVRRMRSLQAPSAGTEQAIRARLEQIDEVVNATVLSNRTMAEDALGLPPKSFRAVVWPTLSSEGREAVAQAIWQTMPAGIYCDGAEALVVTDEQGYEQTVRFSYATEVDITVNVVLQHDDNYPADGAELIEAVVLAYGESLRVGDDVRPTPLIVAIMAAVPGIIDLDVWVGVSGDVVAQEPYPIEDFEIAVFDAARITVTIG